MGWMVLRHLWQVEAREGNGTVMMEQKALGSRTAVSPVWGSEHVRVCVRTAPPPVTLWGQSSGALAYPEWRKMGEGGTSTDDKYMKTKYIPHLCQDPP